MKNKHLCLLSALFLSACAAPTSSLDLANQQIDKTGYIFYQNSEINLHISELKDRLILPVEEYAVPDYINLLPNCLLYTSPSPRDTVTSRMPSSA